MLFRVQSAAVFGIKAYPISVEVDLSSGQKLNFMTVGLPDTAVRESSERVKAALRNCGFVLPAQRITINLAPADLKKEGSAFDLPMAVGILGASGCVRTQNLSAFLFMGELSLDGSIRPIKGTLSMAAMARERGLHHLIVPEANAREAAVVEGVRAFPVRSLAQVIELLNGKEAWIPLAVDRQQLLAQQSSYDVDFRDVKGQYQAKRAMEVAVAGAHNIVLLYIVLMHNITWEGALMAKQKAFSYIRFSTPAQAAGDSYRRQFEAAKQYAAEKGLELDETLIDRGISAFRGVHRTKGKLGQ